MKIPSILSAEFNHIARDNTFTLKKISQAEPNIRRIFRIMNTTELCADNLALALEQPFMPEIVAPRATAPKQRVLRTGVFMNRSRHVDLAAAFKEILHRQRSIDLNSAVVAMAAEISRRSAAPVPSPWLEKLSIAFGVETSNSFDTKIFASLPRAAWQDPALLGEWLGTLKSHCEAERLGRDGRKSMGSVFTPPAVARAIIAEVHVGARRVVDPACGAGIFLLEAFRRAFLRRMESGTNPLQAAEAALSHEIAGIDIDPLALAVAEFSLRFAALQCSGLSRNVPLDLRCADALTPIEDFEQRCECVVGNPPYIEGRGLTRDQLRAFRSRFECSRSGKVNLFAVFIERALELLQAGGVMAFIVPGTFLRNTRYKNLRELLLRHSIESIKPLNSNVFGGRVVETVVLRVRKTPPQRNWRVRIGGERTLQSRLPLGPVLRFCDRLPAKLRRQIELMERHGVPLSDCCEVRDGISTGFQPFPRRLLGIRENERFISADGTAREFNASIHKKIIDGGEFNAFSPIHWEGRYLEYDKRHEHTPPHPGRPFNCQLRDATIFDRDEKLLTRQTAKGLIATMDREHYFVRNSVHVTYAKPEFSWLSLEALCACLNTKFYTEYFLAVTGEKGDVFPQVHVADLKRIPILPGLLKSDGILSAKAREIFSASIVGEPAQFESIMSAITTTLHDAFDIPCN